MKSAFGVEHGEISKVRMPPPQGTGNFVRGLRSAANYGPNKVMGKLALVGGGSGAGAYAGTKAALKNEKKKK